MKKRYQMRVTLDNGRVIRGPIFTSDDYEEWRKLIDQYQKFDVFRFSDGFRRVVIPEGLLTRSYVELRRISLLRAMLLTLWRFVTK